MAEQNRNDDRPVRMTVEIEDLGGGEFVASVQDRHGETVGYVETSRATTSSTLSCLLPQMVALAQAGELPAAERSTQAPLLRAVGAERSAA